MKVCKLEKKTSEELFDCLIHSFTHMHELTHAFIFFIQSIFVGWVLGTPQSLC